MPNYTNQTKQLEGQELYRVLDAMLDAFRNIDDAESEIRSANRQQTALEQEIEKQAKKMKSKWVKVTVALTPLVSIVLLAVFFLIVCVIAVFQMGGAISLTDMSVTSPDGETFSLMAALQIWLAEIPQLIPSFLKTVYRPIIVITVIVYFITTQIDRKLHKAERISALHMRYSANFEAVKSRKSAADQKIQNTKGQSIYHLAKAMLPQEFIDYRALRDLISVMKDYTAQRLEDGIYYYRQEKHYRYVEDMQREQAEAARRAAYAQEQQARIAEQRARNADRLNAETQAAARKMADAAERTARAEEERTRIARDMEWYYRNT